MCQNVINNIFSARILFAFSGPVGVLKQRITDNPGIKQQFEEFVFVSQVFVSGSL